MSKILLVGDIHLGMSYPTNFDKWFNVSKEYFESFLFPLIESKLSKDDMIILLGDLFDDRNFIPINVLNYAQKIIEKMANTCQVKILIGNHDLYTKSTNDINTVKLYKYIPNVCVYESTEKIEFDGKSILMMPWVEKKKDQVEILKKYSGCDYLFCHSDLNGARMHLTSVANKNLDKIDIIEFSGYKHVYSAHIHIRQKNKNFTFVGSIHEMDRNDIGNQKGIYILDLEKESEEFIPNKISPIFKKLTIIKEDDIDTLDEYKNSKDYIDLIISNNLLIGNRKLRRKLEILLESGNFASIEYLDDILEKEEKKKELTKEEIDISINLDYEEYIKNYINSQTYDKNSFKNGILNEYDDIIRIYKENFNDN